jgi:transposase-like protein
MPSGQSYSEDTKAQALAAIALGQSFTQVAALFSVPIGTLKSWKQRESLPDASVASIKRDRVGALMMEYLEAALETLKAQQVIFRDETWLKRQSASEVAILHGVTVDKTIRLLEGLADSPEDE